MILPRILKEHEYWLRLVSLLYFYRPEIYADILHFTCKIPRDPKKISELFSKKKAVLKQLLKRKELTEVQFDILYPEKGRVEINRFDLSLFILVLKHFTKYKPKGGWCKFNQLQRGDKSKAARLIELEHFYKENLATNECVMFHCFHDDWDEIVYFLRELKCDTKKAHGLKHCRLSKSHLPVEFMTVVMQAQTEFVRSNYELHANRVQKIQETYHQVNHNTNNITNNNYNNNNTNGNERHQTGNLVLQNKIILNLIEQLENYAFKPRMLADVAYEKLVEIDKLQMNLEHDIDFVKEMIIIGQTIYEDEEEATEEQSKIDGNQGNNIEENLDKDESMMSLEADGTQSSSYSGMDDESRSYTAVKRLKATYAYSIKKAQQKKGNMNQPFVKPFILNTYKKEEDFDSYKVGTQNNTSRVNRRKKIYTVEKEVQDFENLFDHGNHLLLSGEAGIGKSFLVYELLKQWIRCEIFDDIQFFFLLPYEQLEGRDYETIEEALKILYPNVFEIINFNELMATPNQMLFIFDGWGDMIIKPYVKTENIFSAVKNGLFNRKKEKTFEKPPDPKFLTNVISREYLKSNFLSQKTILTVRPNSVLPDFDIFNETNFNTIDVLGFNHDNIHTYITSYFKNQKQFLREAMLKIEENADFKNILRIPANLHALCVALQSEHSTNMSYNTTTELYFGKLLSLIHKKSKTNPETKNGKTHSHLDPVLFSSIVEASELSYQNITQELDEDTIFMEYEMQDFLTSIYLFMMNFSPDDIRQDYRLEQCLPFVTSFHGIKYILESSQRTILNSFISSLHSCQNCDFLDQLFQSYLNPTVNMSDVLDNSFLVFLKSYFEYRGQLTPNTMYKEIMLALKLHNMTPSDVTNLIYFFTNEWQQLAVIHIDLHTEEPIHQNQMEELAKYILNIPNVKLDFKSLNECSEMFSNVCRTYQNSLLTTPRLCRKDSSNSSKQERIKLENFELAERNVSDQKSDVKFDWLIHLRSLSLYLNTPQVPNILQSLSNAIPYALHNDTSIKLTRLQLKIPLSQGQLIPSLTTLLRSFVYIHEFELEIVETEYEEIHSPYHHHKEIETTEFADMSSIKYVLYKSLNENIVPRNIRRFKITDEISNYEFIINNRSKKITFVLDENDEQHVDVEILSF